MSAPNTGKAFLPQTWTVNTDQTYLEEKATKISQAGVQVSETAQKILSIVLDYTLNKFDDSAERINAGLPKFLSVIESFVKEDRELQMALPAFPFKSSNKVYKVFGTLPDKAEELAIGRLNTMCIRIGEIYKPGAKLTIISDGLTYNDLLCITDKDTWAYGEALRAMTAEKGFKHIGFSRIRNLIDFKLGENLEKLEEIVYVANATNFRRHMLNKFGRDDIDIDQEIANNPDTLMTYCGYRRFLESDLQNVFPTMKGGLSKKAYKKNVSYLAKEMIRRGYAFAGAVKYAYPDHLRLSIHHSTGEHKVSMCLLDTTTGYTTPWHCAVARTVDGQWISAPMGEYAKDPKMVVVYENGRPSYFQQLETAPAPVVEKVSEHHCEFCQIIENMKTLGLKEPNREIPGKTASAKESFCQKHLSLASVGPVC